MPFQSYGGVVWTDQSPPQEPSLMRQGVSLGALAAAGVGGFTLAKREAGGARFIDTVAATARTTGNLSIFQMLNTFRVPEFLSPFTSNKHLGLDNGQMRWEADALKSPSTYHYLKKATGLSDSAMNRAGLRPGMAGADAASELLFERMPGRDRGTLFSVVGGKRHLLAEDMQVMSMAGEIDPFLKHEKPVNRAAKAVMQALDAWDTPEFDPNDVLKGQQRSLLMPIPGMGGKVASAADLRRKTALLRAVPAFEMARFNNLLGGAAEQFLGETGKKAAGVLFGTTGLEVRPGPASSMFARYGMKVGRVGAGLGVLATADWARREFGAPGELVASAATSGALYEFSKRMGVRGKTAAIFGAASFVGQMALPGFDQGVPQGIATMGVKALELRGSGLNPMNYYRRTLEGFFPGVSSAETGALLAIGAGTAMALRMPGLGGQRLPQYLLDRYGHEALKLKGDFNVPATTRDMFWEQVRLSTKTPDDFSTHSLRERSRILRAVKAEHGNVHDASTFMNRTWANAEEAHRQLVKKNPVTQAMLGELEGVVGKWSEGGPRNWATQLGMEAEGFITQAKYSFFGADATATKAVRESIREMGFHGPTGRLGRYGSMGLAVFGLQQLLTGGALGSMQTSDELADIYERGKAVKVKKSRFWEAGGQPFGGGDTSYYRPSLYYMWMNRVREKAVWGHDEPNPIAKFITKNFTYDLERKHYYDRPYPISSAAFEDIPIVGGVLASTIGRVIKPPKLMHTDAWIRAKQDGGMEFASTFEGSRREPAYSLGAAGPGVPGSPYAPMNRLAILSYQARELSGLTGYVRNTVQKIVTGEEQWETGRARLASANEMTSNIRRFWEMDLGGGLFTSEALRRILPKPPGYGEGINPIANTMPSWLGDKFHYGDPYTKVPWGEARLPGTGYEALHPELRGVDPEAYPTIYKYMILGDVSPTSTEFRKIQQMMYSRRQQGITTGWENQMMDRTDKQIQDVLSGLNWEQHTPGAIRLPGSDLTSSFTLGAQQLLRTAAAPAEYLTPFGFRPTQKLMSNRNPIQEYEHRRFYGELAFWDKPWRDWLRPAGYSAARMLGYDQKPLWRQEADDTNAYFDKLEFVKWMKLAEQADAAGDGQASRQYKWAASQTRFGVNPQGNPLGIYWTLPASERPFFNAFAHAQGKERDRILEMVPSDMAHLYQGIWGRMDAGDASLYAGETGGLDEAYMRQQYYGLADSLSVPQDDWIGYNADVDMDDIRVRYVDRFGGDLADYGLWESQLRKSQGQPFLDGTAQDIMPHVNASANAGVYGALNNILGGGANSHVSAMNSQRRPSTAVNFNDPRDAELQDRVTRNMNGY